MGKRTVHNHDHLAKHVGDAATTASDEIRARMEKIIKAAAEDDARGRYLAEGEFQVLPFAAGIAVGSIIIPFVVGFIFG